MRPAGSAYVSGTPLRRGEILRIRDQRWTLVRHVAHETASIVDVRGCERTNRGVRTRFLLPFEPVQTLPLVRAPRVVSRTRWRHLARQTLGAVTPAYDSLRSAAGAAIDLLPFQLEPALAVVRGVTARILIADEVGLGKTIQAGLIVSETLARIADAHVLVVVPAGLRAQWCAEMEERFHLAPVILDSLAMARAGSGTFEGANPWAAYPLVITSVDYIKRPETMRSFEALAWDLVVVDEAHGMGGRSDRNAALTLLGQRARTLVMLTATPHSGDEAAFSRMCGIGDLEPGFPLMVFRRTRQDAALWSARRATWLNVRTNDAEAEMHAALTAYARLVWSQSTDASAARLAMFVLIRRACSSAWSLARSVERRLALLADDAEITEQLALPLVLPDADDEEPASELGAPGLADRRDERGRLEGLLALARKAQEKESKFCALRRLLRRTREPVIVFTEYRDTLGALEAALPGIATVQLHGGLGAADRRGVLDRFRSGGARVLLATDAASEGLNLQQRCRTVVNLEVPWTPVRLEQRIGRVDRIGQQKRVHALQLVAGGTIEHDNVARLVRRVERARDVLAALVSPPATERDVAKCVAGDGERPCDRSAPRPLPRGLVVANLRDAAILEADRAAVARALGAAADVAGGTRPFIAAARRRVRRSGCWACRLEFTDTDDELIWETVVGVAFDAFARKLGPFGDLREQATASGEALEPVFRDQHEALLGRLTTVLEGPIALATSREQAIIAAAEYRHARLAALVQGGLFDRRAERRAAADTASLDELLTRCRARLQRLARRRHPMAGACDAAFALISR
jgi:superfamily II DNA or RNA helicase